MRRTKRRLTRRGAVIIAAALLIAVAVLRSCALRRGEYIGTFDMSHYCLEQWGGYHICGNSEYGCRGDELVPKKSLAVPASVLEKYPVGTEVVAVYPNGDRDRLVIHDTGQALERLGRIDLPVKTHSEAMRLGVIYGVRLYKAK